ncbi:MAG: cadmium-translocating P-type ATPase [Chloroflexota bacterium]|nr:MAG: cadmium-translocating P-type ATPase [Chloroflexota bacterium]
MTTIRKYHLNNLDCANCAARIEEGIQQLPGVRFASVNFATSTLHIEAEDYSRVADTIYQIEPEVEVVAGIEPDDEIDRRAIKDVISIAISIFFLVIGLVFETDLHNTPFRIGEIIVFGSAYTISGASVLVRAWKNIRRNNWFDETFLMSISTLGAIIIGEIPEAVVVMLFFQVGEFIQRRSVNRSRSSIRALMDVRPDQANVKIGGDIHVVSPEDVKVGEIIIIRPGERIPLDGVVRDGHSQVDLSALTGESVPAKVKEGEEVFAGSINQTGLISIEVTKPFEQSSVSRMLELVQNAAARKAKTQKFITRFAQVYSPIMVGIALVVAVVPPLIIPGEIFSTWVYRALVLLVVSCPCALVISIPIGYFGGVGGASRRGILVKGANFLDVLAEVKTVVFDKTGTLTRGVFKVTEIVPYNGWDNEALLKIAAQAETQSNHPVATSIKQAYGKDELLQIPDSFEEVAGYGVRVRLNGKDVVVGNDPFMHKENVPHVTCDVPGTIVHVAVDSEYAGYLVVSDEVKPDSPAVIMQLKELGVQNVIMLSGDREDVAQQVSMDLGLSDYHAELLPEDKVSVMTEMLGQPHQGKIAFVGDGINDAPALGQSDVGIAMGAFGADAAIEVADVVLMTDSPSKVAEAIRLGRRTRKIVWQNIGLALGIKALFILLGTFGVATMWEAVFGDVGVTILAVLNATRVLK